MEFIRKEQKIPADDPDFGPGVDLFDYGYLDSFGTVHMIAQIQKSFGVDMSMVDFYEPEYRTIGGIAAHITSHQGG